jgi:hypothetical protein
MLGFGVVAQLGHQPEDCQLALSRQRGKRPHGRRGRRGVRVVAVDDQQGVAKPVTDLHAQGCTLGHGQRSGDSLNGNAAPKRDRGRGQRVGNLMCAV